MQTNSKTISVVTIAARPSVREKVKAGLQRTDSIELADEAETGKELLKLLELAGTGYPDIVVLDLSLPDILGTEMVGQLKMKYPDIRILVLSLFDRMEYLLESIRAGADGYMTKESSLPDVVDAIKRIAAGNYYFDNASMQFILSKALGKPNTRNTVDDTAYNSLTSREKEVMHYLAEGNSPRQVGKTLFISYRTVENHKTTIFRKLNIKNSAELVHYAGRAGIIQI